MTKDEFEKLQKVQIEIMDEIHEICLKNDITYYIIGGTALGAKRHGGFIPWDFDIDIAMPRPDYDSFKKICQEQLNERYYYKDYLNTKRFTRPHALICIKNTFLSTSTSKYNQKEENFGVYLDVFPLDKSPNNIKEQQKHAKIIEKLKKMKALKLAHIYNKSLYFKNFIKKTVSFLMFWTSVDKINKKMDIEMRRYNNNNTSYLCSMASHYSYKKQCMNASIYGKPILVQFGNKQYYAPAKLDEYLTIIYGDYMKLPSIEEQKKSLSAFEKVIFDK